MRLLVHQAPFIMSNKTIEMFTIRQILRLYASGKGTKFISKSTGIARNTVKKYNR